MYVRVARPQLYAMLTKLDLDLPYIAVFRNETLEGKTKTKFRTFTSVNVRGAIGGND